MDLPVSSLKSHIPISTRCGSLYLTPIASAIMHYTRNKGISAQERSRCIGLGPRKIVASAREADRTFPSQTREKTGLFPDQSSENNGAPSNSTLSKREIPPAFWNNDIINSLTSSHQVRAGDQKRIQTLISEIKNVFNSMGDGETTPSPSKDGSFLGSPTSTAVVFIHTANNKCLEFLNFVLTKFGNHVPSDYPLDLFERLCVIDTVERLGIDRHFKKEIKDALDYVYSYWDERGIGWARDNLIPDIDDTAMGLRILRLHGYNVSSDALKTFKDENGEFFCFMGQTQRGVTDMLNVYRCSQVAFPGETIMEEAKLCTERYLRNALENEDAFDKWAIKKNIRGEVGYALKYPWHRSMPRLEVRSYIENYGPNDVWLGKCLYIMPYISNQNYLELAKLDFNTVQSIHQKEIRELMRWWKSSGFTELKFTRERVVETYFAVASSMFEPEFSTCRTAYTKTSVVIVILDDLYDGYGSPDDIKLFSEAVKRWDLSLLEGMPDQMKICFLGLYNTVNEIAEEGCKRQGHDVLGYIRNLWEIQLAAYTKEAEWSQAKYVPSFDEYMENAQVSIGVATIVLIAILFTGEDVILSQIDYQSKFLQLASLIARLANDITTTYPEERAHGEVVSAIECYMKDHPEITEEEALKYVYTSMVNSLTELNSEYLKSKEMPQNCKRLVFDTARIAQFFCMEGDGFTYSHKMEIKEHVKNCLFHPAS